MFCSNNLTVLVLDWLIDWLTDWLINLGLWNSSSNKWRANSLYLQWIQVLSSVSARFASIRKGLVFGQPIFRGECKVKHTSKAPWITAAIYFPRKPLGTHVCFSLRLLLHNPHVTIWRTHTLTPQSSAVVTQLQTKYSSVYPEGWKPESSLFAPGIEPGLSANMSEHVWRSC